MRVGTHIQMLRLGALESTIWLHFFFLSFQSTYIHFLVHLALLSFLDQVPPPSVSSTVLLSAPHSHSTDAQRHGDTAPLNQHRTLYPSFPLTDYFDSYLELDSTSVPPFIWFSPGAPVVILVGNQRSESLSLLLFVLSP
jgi:hypothetical protein